MYENITKKEFLTLLKNSENELLYANLSLLEAGFEKILNLLCKGDFAIKEARTCTASNSNSLTFSDGSKLYFNDVKKCYKHNNIIISFDKIYDSFDECYRYSVIAYIINN